MSSREEGGKVLRLCVIGAEDLVREVESLGRGVRVLAVADSPAQLRGRVGGADAVLVDSLDMGAEAVHVLGGVPVLLASGDAGIDLYRRAAKKGLKGVVRRPLDALELEEVLDELGGDEQLQPPWSGPGEEEPPGPRSRVVRQQVITVYSPKGGVGKTTLVCNLAAVYAKYMPDLRVVVVDFDPHARVTALLQISTPLSVEAWAEAKDDRFESRVAAYPVGKKGTIHVVPGIRRAINKDLLDEALATDVLEYMRRNADVVVVDCGPDFEDATVVGLESATSVLVVATMDVQTLRDVYRAPRDISLTHTDERKIRVVLNRVPRKPPFSVAQVKEWLPWELVAQIPEDESVPALQNQGRLPVLERSCPFTNAVLGLAARVTPALGDVIASHRGGLISRLFRWKRRGL
ncbi:MAG: AAA family ATPase [Bacillota bacterium]